MKKLENENFNEITKDGLWILDFYAEWCGPCKMQTPVLESLNYEKILKINVDEHQELSNSFGVMSIPTLVFLSNGLEKEKLIGFKTKEEIESILNKYEK